MNELTSAAYLVARAYIDPRGLLLPQIHRVGIYPNPAKGLGVDRSREVAMDVHSTLGFDRRDAYERLSYAVQTFELFAWCRSLLDKEDRVLYHEIELRGFAMDEIAAILSTLSKVKGVSTERANDYLKGTSLFLLNDATLVRLQESMKHQGLVTTFVKKEVE